MLLHITPRQYQLDILKTCEQKSCLVVLPTGMGKTLIALLLTMARMEKHPRSKILFLAPTRPLAQQHLSYFQKHLPELYADMRLFTGKVNAEKRKEIWQTADILFSTPQCIDGQTVIFSENGPIKIEDFFKKFEFIPEIYGKKVIYTANINKKVLGFKDKKIDFVRAIKALKIPTDKIIKIKTELGNTLECTPEHPLLTITSKGELKWKKASDLKKGKRIASINQIKIKENEVNIYELIKNSELRIADKNLVSKLLKSIKKNKIDRLKEYSRFKYNFMPIKIFFDLARKVNFPMPKTLQLTDWEGKSRPVNVPKYLNPKLGYIIGAMLGDGHLGARKGHGGEVVFSELDSEDISKNFKKNVKEVFGIEMKKDKQKGLICYNSALSTILSNLGIAKGRKASKITAPKFIFLSPEEYVANFLKGVFDTDGNAGKYNVSISSVSKEFIDNLKWLFLRIGILGSTEKRKNSGIIDGRKIKESVIYSFRFSGRNQLEKFIKICNPDQNKCLRLVETLENTKRPYTRSKDIIPIQFLLKKIYKNNKGKFQQYLTSCLSKDNLRKIKLLSKGIEAEMLNELISLPIRWLKVQDIKKVKEKRMVYDFTIDKYHNFITNNLISHNCISNDIKNHLYDLSDVSLLIEDECHRCFKNYAYTYIAKTYSSQSKIFHVLGLTASPGSEKSKIKEICQNLGIEAVEIRTRDSTDVIPYLQHLDIKAIKVPFPDEMAKIRTHLNIIYEKKVGELKNRKVLFKPATKTNLIECQGNIFRAISNGSKNFNMFAAASACAQAIKLQHSLELLETQTLATYNAYVEKLLQEAKEEKSRAVKQLVSNPEFTKAHLILTELLEKKVEHPKLIKLKELVENEIKKTGSKHIIFSQYRDTVAKICKELNTIDGVKAQVFVGQAHKGDKKSGRGLNQKEQQNIIREFSLGNINVLAATSIGEEGLDIPEVNSVILYEPVPSAIRQIQRRGRTARLMKGKLLVLVTEGTRDEAYYWAAFQKEKKMHSALEKIKEELENGKFEIKKTNSEEVNKQIQKELI